MSVIKITVNDQNLLITDAPKIAAQGVNENYIQFTFSEDWDGFGKTANFYRDTAPTVIYQSVVDQNGYAAIPHEITANESWICIGLSGVKDDVVKTSEILKYKIVNGLYVVESTDPTPDVYEQILALAGNIEALVTQIGTDTAASIAAIEASTASSIANIQETVDGIDDAVDQVDARMDTFIASQTGTSNGTLITETSLFTASSPAKTDITVSDDINNYNYIDIRYAVFGRTKISRFLPSDIETGAHWSEFEHVNTIDIDTGATDPNARSVLRKVGFKLTRASATSLSFELEVWRWDGKSTTNGVNAETIGSTWNVGIYSITGVKYEAAGTSKDAELADIRVGADGVTYATAGEAVRTQFTNADNDIQELKEDLSDVETSIGDLSDLTTSEKGNLVAAINEAAQTGGSGGSVEIALPKMYITGDISEMTAEKNEVKKYSYVFVDPDGEQHFGYCSMKWQGESSMAYPKKNYTIKFFYDAPHRRKEAVDLLPLGITKNKFVVKANWIDRSQARNVVSCRLWGQMVKSRHTAPPELLASAPNWGAINGYPIKIYVNGTFHGLYSFNLPKDEDLFGMDADNPLHCVVCGDNNQNTDSNASAFRSTTLGNSWELEVPDTWQTYDVEEEGQTVTHAVKDNLSSTIAFVINSTDEEFVAGINDHIDLESAIDYFLLMFIDRGVDSAARNLIMLTYDGGNKWYCSAYDKDMTWGNGSMGNPAYTADTACPGGYINTNSLLWERLVECFGDDIWERWCELKTTILSPDYIKAEFEYFWKDITDADYAADIAKWPTIPQSTYDFKYQIFALIDARWTYMDGVIRAMRTPVACTSITLNESTLTFTSGTPQTLTATVEPANTTYEVEWSSSDTEVVTVVNGVVTPVGNGNATITATCGTQSATCTVTVSALSYTVTLTGSGATLTPTSSVSPGGSYSGTLTANTGYTIDSVVVTMGGVDITSTAYSDGSISIASVTGNIVVTVATSVYIDPTGLVYSLQSPLTFDGQTYVDTGYKYSGSGSLSIFVEAENPQDMSTTQNLFGQKTGNTARMCWSATNRTISPSLNSGSLQSGVDANIGTRFKAVFRFDADRTVQTNRSSVSGVEKTNRYGYNSDGVTPPASVWGNNLWLGGQNADGVLTNPMLTGKMYQFRIYERRLTDAETAALLGLSSLSTTPFTVDLDPTS